jgi:hypothetical protein
LIMSRPHHIRSPPLLIFGSVINADWEWSVSRRFIGSSKVRFRSALICRLHFPYLNGF